MDTVLIKGGRHLRDDLWILSWFVSCGGEGGSVGDIISITLASFFFLPAHFLIDKEKRPVDQKLMNAARGLKGRDIPNGLVQLKKEK